MLECDYLVIGTGASGMAFADSIVHESTDRTVIMVDKLAEPGGHWNNAYDFVKLHQPACFYGVASEKLEKNGVIEQTDMKDLSSKQEILEYYRMVMDKLVKTGRVKHFGECTYKNDKLREIWNYDTIPIQSVVDKEGTTHQVKVKRRVVDATYLKVSVPSMTPPRYNVDPGITCIPINGINDISDTSKKYLIMGAGKTGIDAILHLLGKGVQPDNITWVVPNDSWLIKREWFNPATVLLNLGPNRNDKPSVKESLLFQEKHGWLTRLDENVWPEKYKCATVAANELEQLRSIRNIIRQGRATSVTKTHLVMAGKDGTTPTNVPYPEGSIVVDCSAGGLPPQPEVPIFQGGKIVIQATRTCLICLSASVIAYVDCHDGFQDDADRNNSMCPVPYPATIKDYIRTELLMYRNIFMGYTCDPRVEKWVDANRLNETSHTSTLTLLKLFAGGLYDIFKSTPQSFEAKKRHYEMEYGKEFEFQVYSPKRTERMIRNFWIMKVISRGFLVATVGALSYGLCCFI